MIHLVFGPQGAGKSTLARRLADQHRGLRLSIDEWMAQLDGPDLPQPPDLGWVMARVARCAQRIWALATDLPSRSCAWRPAGTRPPVSGGTWAGVGGPGVPRMAR
jgi:hypothetical protein